MKVFLAGEGPGELGRWFNDPSYRADVTDIGALEALLRRIRADGWQVEGALQWKRITKYRRGRELHAAELLNVLGVALEASEAGCQILAFMRDRDGVRERERDIEDGLARATEKFPDLQIIGVVAIEELEAWILAMLGELRSESRRDAKSRLAEHHGVTTRREKIGLIEQTELARWSPDASSLHRWLERARVVLNPTTR